MPQQTLTSEERASVPPVEAAAVEEKAVRRRARRRAGLCPGAGWALLGYPRRGMLVLAGVSAMLTALAWLVATLSPAGVWAAGVATLVALTLWIAEILDVSWCRVRSSTESLLVRRFRFVTFVVWAAGLIVVLLIPLYFGSMAIQFDRMAPAVEPGERLIYHRRVAESDLKPGTVVLFQLPPWSKAGAPGSLEVARILAVPGDKLAVRVRDASPQPKQPGRTKRSKPKRSARVGHYLVNREASTYQGAADADAPLSVPAYPDERKVPDGCYFVVEDSEDTGTDSQQLEWVRRADLVSTRLFHVAGLRPVN
ncbi:MAG TPA: S26 family signal peptidase [Pirellulales bacterium]|nr:S26 family signal peptidase [Pirellulales bacterium]